MKINDAPRPAATRRAPGARRESGFTAEVAHAAEGGRVGPAAPLTSPDAILLLHEIAGDGAGGRRAVERAHDMLDELEKLRLAMIEG